MSRKGFKNLIVWQKAKELAVEVYRLSGDGMLGKDFGLRDQMRRSAVSIASNLAEGDERGTDKESVRFFHIAKGSLAELRTQIQIALSPIAHRPSPIIQRNRPDRRDRRNRPDRPNRLDQRNRRNRPNQRKHML